MCVWYRDYFLETLARWFRCCDELIARFKEREENVRTDVVGCFSKLLEAAFVSGVGTPMSMTTSRGRLARQESGGGQPPHHHYFPVHRPEAPMQMVRDGDELRRHVCGGVGGEGSRCFVLRYILSDCVGMEVRTPGIKKLLPLPYPPSFS